MLVQEEGEFTIIYNGRSITVKYYYWSLYGSTYVNVYDKNNNEYRFWRQPSRWRSIRDENNWPLDFRKALAVELEKVHARVEQTTRSSNGENENLV